MTEFISMMIGNIALFTCGVLIGWNTRDKK